MTAHRTTTLIIFSAGIMLVPLFAHAAGVVGASESNTTWQQAVSLGKNPTAIVVYGRLSGTGDAKYYTFTNTTEATVTAVVETTTDKNGIEPRVVLYKPKSFTIGPALPMPQPPETLAAVYPANAATTHMEGPLLTTLKTRVNQSMMLTEHGRYYLAVYNAGKNAGPYRLTLRTVSAGTSPMSAKFRTWWLTSIWLGPQYGALTIPLLLVTAAVLAWLIVTKVPHPRPTKKRTTKRTVRHARVS